MTGPRRVVGVIDDDPSVGRALSRLFRMAGLEVSLFATAEEYLADPGRDAAGCLVIDLRLPGMSGLELQERLQSVHAAPTLLITAHADEAVRNRALALGALGFFVKPFDNRRLLDTVLRALEARGGECE